MKHNKNRCTASVTPHVKVQYTCTTSKGKATEKETS